MYTASENGKSSSTSASSERQRLEIEGEPDLISGSLDEWRAYRQGLSSLPQEDENVRVAIAVADARIARLNSDR
ncbi:MAG: hypothetical protein CMM52_12135 [Rhodospirillaceae bacterium]|nr:hypothetical protein [Rhodospirillaceae bacterium]|tara:strand:- start:2793 stop:3014 length:222 start_codon:yes stop_codon:yes gene_type:complete